MPSFQFKALQMDGTMAEGRIEAGGRQDAFRQIEGRGLRPISLKESGGSSPAPAQATEQKAGSLELPWKSRKVTPRMLRISRACFRACLPLASR